MYQSYLVLIRLSQRPFYDLFFIIVLRNHVVIVSFVGDWKKQTS